MPSIPPGGEPAPLDGRLPHPTGDRVGESLSCYVHVPFCRVRCGYCDFNTYTASELGPGASRATYADQAVAEVGLARRVLEESGRRPSSVSTVFVGGGTPTLLPPEDLASVLGAVRDSFGLTDDAEVTTEANPDSVTADGLVRLREAGFTRISFGMQSAVPAVLAVLDRTHDPERVPVAVEWARRAGFDQVSLDLIYGTPGESLDDWATSLDAALACEPDHVSAYSLIVEDGTALARRVRRGEVPTPDDDDLADKYVAADERLTAAGLGWYEVSNWARDDAARCRHNLAYWRGADWWGIGPGAHSHVDGTRWWNVKHPAAYAARLADGQSPAQARELLDAPTRLLERVLLEVRLREGLDLGVLEVLAVLEGHDDVDSAEGTASSRVAQVVGDGLAEVVGDRLVLTLRGRLLADAVVRTLLG